MIRPKTGLPSVRNHFLGDFWAGTTESPATGVHAGPGKAGVEISLFEIYGKDLFKPSWKKPTTNSERVSKMPHQINQYPRPQAKRVSGPSEKTFSASNAFLPDPFPYRAPSTLPGIFKMQKFNLLQVCNIFSTNCKTLMALTRSLRRPYYPHGRFNAAFSTKSDIQLKSSKTFRIF